MRVRAVHGYLRESESENGAWTLERERERERVGAEKVERGQKLVGFMGSD